MMMGEYDEERLLENGKIIKYTIKAPFIRFISRSNNHRMLEARGLTISMSITGPWDKIWSETLIKDKNKRFLTWGRKVLFEEKPNDKRITG